MKRFSLAKSLQQVDYMLQVRDAGNLLTRAGLMIPSVDVDEVTVNYDDIDSLIHHLRSALYQMTVPEAQVLF